MAEECNQHVGQSLLERNAHLSTEKAEALRNGVGEGCIKATVEVAKCPTHPIVKRARYLGPWLDWNFSTVEGAPSSLAATHAAFSGFAQFWREKAAPRWQVWHSRL